MSAPIVLLLSLCVGILIAAQPAINAELARAMESPFGATLVSLMISVACVLPILLWRHEAIRWRGLVEAPGWVWIGGVAGACFVLSGLTFAPRIGVALFLSIVITGQLLAAAIIDHYGLFGVAAHSMNGYRLIGLLLVFSGVLVFRLAPK